MFLYFINENVQHNSSLTYALHGIEHQGNICYGGKDLIIL